MRNISFVGMGIAAAVIAVGVSGHFLSAKPGPVKHAQQVEEDTQPSQMESSFSKVEKAVVVHALARRAERIKAEPASFVLPPNSHITEEDKLVQIPENTDFELSRMTRVLNLNELEALRTKGLVEVFAKGAAMLADYPEPARTQKRLELQRQFRLAMHTALPREKEDAADHYLERR